MLGHILPKKIYEGEAQKCRHFMVLPLIPKIQCFISMYEGMCVWVNVSMRFSLKVKHRLDFDQPS